MSAIPAEMEAFKQQAEYINGQVIFKEGDVGRHMYVILAGNVDIRIEQDGRPFTAARLGAGDFFGEMSLLEGLPRSGTAIAVGTTKLAVIDADTFPVWATSNSALTWKMLTGLSGRLRNLNREIAQKIGRDLQEVKDSIQAQVAEISETISKIATSAQEIDDNEKQLAAGIGEAQRITKEITKSLQFVRQVAMQTTILGLNAGIEAAHSGEHGRGFAVVASEIKKLSEQSKTNGELIGELTEQIDEQMDRNKTNSLFSAQRSQTQAQQTKEMVIAVEKVDQLARRLAEISQTL